MLAEDLSGLIHPAIAVAVVFPLIGIVANRAWQARSRRLQTAAEGKSRIPPIVGQEHVQIGRFLAAAVIGITLIGLAHPIFSHIHEKQIWQQNPSQVIFVIAIFAATTAAFGFLNRVKQPLWRAILAILTGTGIVILGSQEGVYRRDGEWYYSHYYIGVAATMLMIVSVAILPDIYRSLRWRYAHAILNLAALILFVCQGITGTRDLLDIPPSWQKPYIVQLYKQKCFEQNCIVQPAQVNK